MHACATATPARLLLFAVMGADALSCGCDGGVSVPRLLTREVATALAHALARSSRARHGLAAAVALARAPSHVAAGRLACLLEARRRRRDLRVCLRRSDSGWVACPRALVGSCVLTAACSRLWRQCVLRRGHGGNAACRAARFASAHSGLSCSRLSGVAGLRQLCCVPARGSTSCALACRVLPWWLWPLA